MRSRPAIDLANLRLAFACQERWEDMVGDDRVRACAGCNKQVFNLSAMTRDEAQAVLATRGVTPCVRFYRRPDGTVMTTDCPMGPRREGRRLAVVASSLAAGTALTAAAPAMAEPPAAQTPPPSTIDFSDAELTALEAEAKPVHLDETPFMGLPDPGLPIQLEMGEIVEVPQRPAIEWSVWTRLGAGVATRSEDTLARRVMPPMADTSSAWEAAVAADLTLGVSADGDLRPGVWAELRTSSGPVAGAELVVEGLPPHPYTSRIAGAGSVVLRAGGNARVLTGALGLGYVGSWPRNDPWIGWARHLVGARVVVSVNRAVDAPHDWSATLGLEVDPIGAAHAIVDLVWP